MKKQLKPQKYVERQKANSTFVFILGEQLVKGWCLFAGANMSFATLAENNGQLLMVGAKEIR